MLQGNWRLRKREINKIEHNEFVLASAAFAIKSSSLRFLFDVEDQPKDISESSKQSYSPGDKSRIR